MGKGQDPEKETKAIQISSSAAPSAASPASPREAQNPSNPIGRQTRLEPEGEAKPVAVSRRRFLAAIGAVGMGAAAVLVDPSAAAAGRAAATRRAATAPHQAKKPLPQWTMILDLRYCDGCKVCTAACQKAHYLPEDVEWIKVYTLVDADGQSYHLPRPCQMCEDPPCQAVCPVGATFRTDEGLVLIDQNVCIGCRTCMAACPYETRYFNTSPPPKVPRQPYPTSPEWPVPQVMDTVGKCVWCAARLPFGMLPECVSACQMGVIYIGDLTTDVAVNGQGNVIKISTFLRDNDAIRLKEELGTNPRVWYVPGHGQDLSAWA